MIEVKRKNNEFLRPITFMFLLTGGTQIQILACQALSAKISLEYLNAFSMLNYIWLFCQVIGFSLGETCYILLNKNTRLHKHRQFLGGSLMLYFLLTLFFVFLIFYFDEFFVRLLNIDQLPEVRLNLAIWVLISFIYGLCSIFFYFMAHSQSLIRLFLLGPTALVINIVFGSLAIFYFEDKQQQFLYLNLSFLASWIAFFFIGLYFVGKDVRFKLNDLKILYSRAKHLIVGDILLQSLILIVPLFFSIALNRSLGGESLAAYNVGFRILEIFIVLHWSISFYGISWLSQIIQFRGELEWSKCLRTISRTSIAMVGLPIVAVTIFMSPLLRIFFNLQSLEATIIASATMLAFIPTVLLTGTNCKIKVFERHVTKAVVNGLLIFGIGLPAVYFFSREQFVFGIVGCGLLLPSLLESTWLYFYNKLKMSDSLSRHKSKPFL